MEMGSSLPLTLINTVLYFSYPFINFLVTFFEHRNSLIKSYLLIYGRPAYPPFLSLTAALTGEGRFLARVPVKSIVGPSVYISNLSAL